MLRSEIYRQNKKQMHTVTMKFLEKLFYVSMRNIPHCEVQLRFCLTSFVKIHINKMKHLLSWCNEYIRTSSPLFFQWQGGVHGAGLGFRAAAGGRRWQQGWQRGSQNLLGPAFLPPMLMLMLGWWMLGLSSKCRVRRLIFGGAIRAVKLC